MWKKWFLPEMLLLFLFVCVCVFFLSKMQQCIYVKPNYVESYSPEQNTEGKRALYWKNGCVQTSQKLDGLALKIYGSLRSSADQDVKRRCRHMNVAICDKNRIEESCCFLNNLLLAWRGIWLSLKSCLKVFCFVLFSFLSSWVSLGLYLDFHRNMENSESRIGMP